ncbi:MAG: lasso peptide biosynthesis B2 protein [Haloferacaceae archaeon]
MTSATDPPEPSRALSATTAVLSVVGRILLPVAGLGTTRRIVGSLASLSSQSRTADPEHVSRAVTAVHRRVPVSSTCLTQAVVGESLLTTGGHRPEFKLGVRKREGELHAHAWVELDGAVLIGDLDDLSEYRTLSTGPTKSDPGFPY